MKTPIMKVCVLTVTALMAGISASFAQSIWTGADGSDWSNTLNWEGATLPGNGANIYFGAADSYTVDRDIPTDTNRPFQIIFTGDADAYTFEGNRISLNGTTAQQVVNYSGKTQTFTSGLQFGHWNSSIDTANGDIVVEQGIVGASLYTPVKRGIGTLTIYGADGVNAEGILRIYGGTLILDGYVQNFGGESQVIATPDNNLAIEIVGENSGTTTLTKTKLNLQAGSGAAAQIRLNANGGDGIQLSFTEEASALTRFAPATLNVDISSHAANSVSFASVDTSGATALTAGIFRWATVTDAVGTGFATMSGANFVRNTTTTLLTGGDATNTGTNYHVGDGTTTLSANRSTGSLTIHAGSGGTITGGNLTTGGLLVREGTGNYTIDSNLLPLTNSSQLYIHQYSTDGSLTLNGLIHNASTGVLTKAGPGTLVVGSSGEVRQSGITYVSGGRFVLDGKILRSTGVRVFDKATLAGGGEIGTEAPSAVTIYAGGTLEGDTSGALDITGTLDMESYSNFAMTLDYEGADYVTVSGMVAIDGDVDLKLSLAAAPVIDQIVLLLESDVSLAGTFATINGEVFGAGWNLLAGV